MAQKIRHNRQRSSKTNSRRKTRNSLHLQRPNGSVGHRVRKVGAERFAIVCIDPAKHRSEWMMADYFGNILIENASLEHNHNDIQKALSLVRQACLQHHIDDLIVVIERTGNYHKPIKHAFAQAGFDTRIIHPFATKQFRLPADPGNKTDPTDLAAMHRAAVAGFGLIEPTPDPVYRHLQLLTRHRRNLVQKASALCCQIREHLHLTLPGYTALFSDLWKAHTPLAIARLAPSPYAILQLGPDQLAAKLHQQHVRFQHQTIAKVIAWAQQAAKATPDPDATLHHRIWTELDELRRHLQKRIAALEVEIVALLVHTPYIRLLTICGINVVSAAELAGEMGPIRFYPNANAITGRAGLYPARYQSDRVDRPDGPIIRSRNRRLRAALMLIAANLAKCNNHFRALAELERKRNIDPRATRVKIAKRFSRIAFAALAGNAHLTHPCATQTSYLLDKLRDFHDQHNIPMQQLMDNLAAAAKQLPEETRNAEAKHLAEQLKQQTQKRRGPTPLAEILPAVLAPLKQTQTTGDEHLN